MGRVDQKIAIVTGGGNGIGRAIAERLAAEGAIVTVTDQNPAAGKAVADAVDNIQFLEHDVRIEADWAKVMDNVLQRHGRLDILINNAGIPSSGRAIEMQEEEWERVIDTNLKGAWLMAREVGSQMIQYNIPGRIINIASVIGVKTSAKRVLAYSVSKAGLVSLTQSFALELAEKGICVNAIAPGYIETELNNEFLQSAAGQRISTRIPLGRFGETTDLDGVLLMLAGAAAKYITGSIITVDGGLSLSTL